MISLTVPLILASKSPRRAQLLRQIGLNFISDASNVDELFEAYHSPQEIVSQLSFKKANEVAERHSKGIIVGSDTIVVAENSILGKPENETEAVTMLQQLSGKTHSVFTGFCLLDSATKKYKIEYSTTDVTFRTLTVEEILSYVRTGSPMDKAGAYGIQDDFGAVFVERINGDYYTVVGFPLAKFYLSLINFSTELGYLKGTL